MCEDLLGGNGMHPRHVSVHRFFGDHLQQIHGVNSTHWDAFIVDDEQMVPIVFRQHIKDGGHGIARQQGMGVLHHAPAGYVSYSLALSGGFGLAGKRSRRHAAQRARSADLF